MPKADAVVTSKAASRNLADALGKRVVGLLPWETTIIHSTQGWDLKVTAVPVHHGEWPLIEAIVGHTIGFILEWPGQKLGPVYISGDTVFYSGIQEIGQRFQGAKKIGTAFFHMAGVKFYQSYRHRFLG